MVYIKLSEPEIVSRYVDDESVTVIQLATEYGVSKNRIRAILTRNGIDIRHVRHLTSEERELICKKYFEEHAKSYHLAKEFNVNYSTIRETLMRDERFYKTRVRLNQEEREAIITEYMDNDITHTELAERYGRTRSWISRIILNTEIDNPKYEKKIKEFSERKKTPKKKLRVPATDLIAEIEETGVTQSFLAKKYGVSESCINHAIARFKKRGF